MNRSWLALGILVALIAVGVLISHSVSSHSESTAGFIDKAEALVKAGSFQDALSVCREARTHWKEKELLLAAFLRHDALEEVEGGLVQLISYAECSDRDDFLAMCAQIREHLEHIRELEKPLIKNIL